VILVGAAATKIENDVEFCGRHLLSHRTPQSATKAILAGHYVADQLLPPTSDCSDSALTPTRRCVLSGVTQEQKRQIVAGQIFRVGIGWGRPITLL
jgi:hypothetical protein